WYGFQGVQANPRGVASDGAGNYWGCGTPVSGLYYSANTQNPPIQFQNTNLSTCIKVINHAVYTSINTNGVQNPTYSAGIYSLVDSNSSPAPYPNSLSYLQPYIRAAAPFVNCVGFDINPQGTVAYVVDVGSASEPGGV